MATSWRRAVAVSIPRLSAGRSSTARTRPETSKPSTNSTSSPTISSTSPPSSAADANARWARPVYRYRSPRMDRTGFLRLHLRSGDNDAETMCACAPRRPCRDGCACCRRGRGPRASNGAESARRAATHTSAAAGLTGWLEQLRRECRRQRARILSLGRGQHPAYRHAVREGGHQRLRLHQKTAALTRAVNAWGPRLVDEKIGATLLEDFRGREEII